MKETQKAALNRCSTIICEDLEPLEILPRLVAAGVITRVIALEINAEPTNYKKNDRLISVLITRGDEAFDAFLTALRDTGQIHIAQRVEESQSGIGSNLPAYLASAGLLKSYYSSKAFCRSQPFDELLYNFDLKLGFVSLTMEHESTKTEDHCTLITKVFKPTSNQEPKLMIMEGNAGSGKTTLIRRIAYDWANGKLEQFAIVLYAEFSQLMAGYCASIIEMGLAGVSAALGDFQFAQLRKDVGNLLLDEGEKILVLLDGYDEARCDQCKQLEDVLRKQICPQLISFVIISSRPEHVAVCRLNTNHIAHVNLLGFETNEQKVRFILAHFTENQNAHQNFEEIEEVMFSKQHLVELAALPLFIAIFCMTNKNCKSDSHIEFYNQICTWLLKRYIKEKKSTISIPELAYCGRAVPNINNCLQELSIFPKLGQLAYETKCKQQNVFSQQDLLNYEIPPFALQIGLLATDYSEEGMEVTKSFRFPHESLQDFFSCMYLLYWCGDNFLVCATLIPDNQSYQSFLNDFGIGEDILRNGPEPTGINCQHALVNFFRKEENTMDEIRNMEGAELLKELAKLAIRNFKVDHTKDYISSVVKMSSKTPWKEILDEIWKDS